MSRVQQAQADGFEVSYPVVVVGAGGCGLTAALAVRDAGVEVLVIERDATPLGSTAMSTGLIPAAGTPEQAAQGIDDDPQRFAADIMAKTKGRADPALAQRLAEESAETVAWLRDAHGAPLELVDGFLYPGHSCRRMYGTPNRSGGELMGALQAAAEQAGADLLTQARVERLFVDGDGAVVGVEVERPGGDRERIGCGALVLACCGYGGNAELVRRWVPEMAEATYHGHPGNQGDAVDWGQALGAQLADMTGYQGHGGLAAGYGVPILWPLIMEGGVQVNGEGRRFSNETEGYSEQAAKVNAQPGRVAWSVWDERLHQMMLAFDDYREALSAGAVVEASNVQALAERIGAPTDTLASTLAHVEACTRGEAADQWGRDFSGKPPLTAPYRAAKVTGALFHTQGGLAVDGDARVLREDGRPFSNLFAGGGAARGVSGPDASGYLAGNGLLTATTLGKLAGRAAARLVTR
ncbi:MAG TPA: FAD-dependent oxidoreductase [Caulobacteraceae bacterium]|nr:FAD-dependent oxidoreductase [Caulobacteraceae bacterium]